jgi:hypothetical protein
LPTRCKRRQRCAIPDSRERSGGNRRGRQRGWPAMMPWQRVSPQGDDGGIFGSDVRFVDPLRACAREMHRPMLKLNVKVIVCGRFCRVSMPCRGHRGS